MGFSINVKQEGQDFLEWLKRLNPNYRIESILNRYGAEGVSALRAATPIDTGNTASQWGYEIEKKGDGWSIHWTNDHINQGVNIAVILQYGHGTGTGGYVSGYDYINPSLRPIFDQIANEAWKEVTA